MLITTEGQFVQQVQRFWIDCTTFVHGNVLHLLFYSPYLYYQYRASDITAVCTTFNAFSFDVWFEPRIEPITSRPQVLKYLRINLTVTLCSLVVSFLTSSPLLELFLQRPLQPLPAAQQTTDKTKNSHASNTRIERKNNQCIKNYFNFDQPMFKVKKRLMHEIIGLGRLYHVICLQVFSKYCLIHISGQIKLSKGLGVHCRVRPLASTTETYEYM